MKDFYLKLLLTSFKAKLCVKNLTHITINWRTLNIWSDYTQGINKMVWLKLRQHRPPNILIQHVKFIVKLGYE